MAYKDDHEAFVSGNAGSSHQQICLTVLTAVLFVHLRDVLVLKAGVTAPCQQKQYWRSLLRDFLLVIIPLQLTLTWCNQIILPCFITTLSVTLLLVVMDVQTKPASDVANNLSLKDIPMDKRRAFVTYFRAFVNILTAFSILAVDFKVFPRYLGKTETYGKGLMDVGVGCFLVANAIVSPEARGKISAESPVSNILKSVKSSLPLIVLGCGRVLAVKLFDYQEHVTEYGVHWNFFFTLAVVKIGCTIIFCTVPPRLWNTSGVLLMGLYQHNLTYGGLKDYIIKGQDGKGGRGDLIDANREGLYSAVGYLCVYIMGVQLGKLIMTQRSNAKEWVKVCVRLLLVCGMTWVLLYFCEKKMVPISRRFANLSYLLWMMAFNSLILLTMLIFDIVCTCLCYIHHKAAQKESHSEETTITEEIPFSTSTLLDAVNYNGLAYFLLANVLTGLVNMLVKTIYQSDVIAFSILTGYMFALSGIMSFLYHKKVSFKIW